MTVVQRILSLSYVLLFSSLSVFALETDLTERTWPDYFKEHKKYFQPKTYSIKNVPVWSINNPDNWAVNSILIEGADGLIVYDTGLSRQQGEEILKEIRKISDKPIKAIFYSHHHPDHYSGTDALVSRDDVKSGKVKIYAWHNFEQEMSSEWGATGPIQALRVGFYTGVLLPSEDEHHHGCCGSRYGGTSGYIPPTDTFSTDTDITIAGVRLNVFYTGGEAVSEFGLYLPDFKTMLIADEIYPAQPNMYTIRGAQFRKTEGYLRAYDAVLNKAETEHLLGTHMPPISGRENIRDIVTKYRDLVQYVHDQSVRQINKGAGIDELMASFKDVPPWLELEPYNTEMYGTLEHNAAAQFTGYMGWFEGDPTAYKPTPKPVSAQRHIKLMGGRKNILAEAEDALVRDDPQWGAEILTYLIQADPEDKVARKLKARALRMLGYKTLNTTWRAWYLTAALEHEGKLDLNKIARYFGPMIFPDPANIPLKSVFENYRYQVRADRVGGGNISLAFDVETDEDITLQLRNGVLLIRDGITESADVVIKAKRADLNPLLSGKKKWADATFNTEGDKALATTFWNYFDTDIFASHISVR